MPQFERGGLPIPREKRPLLPVRSVGLKQRLPDAVGLVLVRGTLWSHLHPLRPLGLWASKGGCLWAQVGLGEGGASSGP